jgi:hypothetical protein
MGPNPNSGNLQHLVYTDDDRLMRDLNAQARSALNLSKSLYFAKDKEPGGKPSA